MSRNGKKRGGSGFAYKDISDSAGEDSDGDGVALVMTDSDSPREGTSRKYVVAEDDDGKLSSICKPQKFTRNERICLVVGGLILVAVVILLIVVVIVTQLPGANGGGSGNGTNPGGNNTNHGGNGTNSTVNGIMPWENVRLPTNVTPSHYDVKLDVNLETFEVKGFVNITCSVNKETSYILVHAKDMSIGQGVHLQYGRDLTSVETVGTFQPENDFYVLKLSAELQPGTVYVHLPFNYSLRNDLAGFYKSSYTNAGGQERFLATTQFEPTDARRAFPCFDEPSLKANFTIHITHDSQYHAVSNMPKTDVTNHTNGTSTTHFETSVRMSTYLVAFIVSDFDCMTDFIEEGHEDRPLMVRDIQCTCLCRLTEL